MRHLKSGRKLKRTHSHRKALLSNLAQSLIVHKRITTTEAKAKELRMFVESIITRAKNAYIRERANQLPAGHTVDVHARRMVARVIKNKAVVQELFDTVAPVVESRPGGYTRVVKLGTRRGDGARTALIELVDFFADSKDGAVYLNRNRRTKRGQKKAETVVAQQAVEQALGAAVEALEVAVPAEQVAEVIESVADESTSIEETPATDSTDASESTDSGDSN